MTSNNVLPIKGVHPPKTRLGLSKIHILLEAAEKLFSEKSFYEVSVSDICKEAHTAVGTFYIYFETKTDIYRYLLEQYKRAIQAHLAEAIAGCTTRLEIEREGIKAFVHYAVANPNVYNIIWGSLAVEKQMFENYYVSFAESYARALGRSQEDLTAQDVHTVAYMLMGITNFVSLKAIFENMTDAEIDAMVDKAVLPVLEHGLFR
jgi:AcrR family transcriptional regulator